jgi:asparagine synthase (glutamine-hydrolysing)
MSSICGALYTDGKTISKDRVISMMDSISVHPCDTSSALHFNNVFMGCNLQYVTPESTDEILPFKESLSGLLITADAIIDNRKELSSLLNISANEQKTISDSQLILNAYKTWGTDCPMYLEGDYAFAIYDTYKQELFCARDHVGKRTFYYYYDKDCFIFSTLMKPIYAFKRQKLSLNERWIADYLGLFGVIHELECNDTIYEGIYQLPPATSLVLNSKGIHKEKYWDPLELKTIKFKTDYEYDEAFRDIFSKAVKAKTRTSGKVGLFISGGLDSSAVGAIAARELALENKKLKAYHSLPISNYTNTLSSKWIADESEYIDELIKMYPNIDVSYIRCEDRNSYHGINHFNEILEHPYKPIVNFYWVNAIFEQASKDGCKVILDGQYGNFSISFGDYITNIYELLKRGRLYSIYKEINAYSKLHNYNCNQVAKQTIKTFIPRNLFNKNDSFSNRYSLVNPELANKWGVYERIEASLGSKNIFGVQTIDEMRKFHTNPVFFSHLGSLETKMGMANGIINRDPTRDKNVLEFCSSIPWHQFVYEGKERYLVRKSMTGIIPDKIRCNYEVRGKQGADWVQRIVPIWTEIKDNLSVMLNDSTLEYYVDTSKLKQALNQVEDINTIELQHKNTMNIKTLFKCLVFYNYLKEVKS